MKIRQELLFKQHNLLNIYAWESLKNLKILNLGCGSKPIKGMINCDKSKYANADKVFNFEKKFPFKNNSIDGIYAHYTVEHIQNIWKLMEEIFRVCKNGAWIEFHVPHAIHHASMAHPDHKHQFTWGCFDWVTRPESGSDRYTKTDILFKYVKRRFMYADCNQIKRGWFIRFVDWLSNKYPFKYERMFAYWVGSSEEIIYIMEVVKNK